MTNPMANWWKLDPGGRTLLVKDNWWTQPSWLTQPGNDPLAIDQLMTKAQTLVNWWPGRWNCWPNDSSEPVKMTAQLDGDPVDRPRRTQAQTQWTIDPDPAQLDRQPTQPNWSGRTVEPVASYWTIGYWTDGRTAQWLTLLTDPIILILSRKTTENYWRVNWRTIVTQPSDPGWPIVKAQTKADRPRPSPDGQTKKWLTDPADRPDGPSQTVTQWTRTQKDEVDPMTDWTRRMTTQLNQLRPSPIDPAQTHWPSWAVWTKAVNPAEEGPAGPRPGRTQPGPSWRLVDGQPARTHPRQLNYCDDS